MPKEKKLIGTGVKQKALSAEEKKRLEEKEKKEKEKERKERKAREAMDRTFGMKGRKAREKVERDMKNNPHANTPATAEAPVRISKPFCALFCLSARFFLFKHIVFVAPF